MNPDREYFLKLQSSIYPKKDNSEYFLNEWQRVSSTIFPENITYTPSNFCKDFDISIEQFENLTGPTFKDLINKKNLIDPFLESLDEASYNKLKTVITGTLPKRSIDAETFTGPFGTPLIVFHDGLNWLIDHFKWIQTFREEESFSQASRMYYMSELQKLQFFFLKDGKLDIKLSRIQLSEDSFLKYTIQVQFLKVFIFAHEYAHIYLDHLKVIDETQVDLSQSGKPTDFKNYTINQHMEFEADELAYSWYKVFLQGNSDLVKAANEYCKQLLVLPLELLYFFNLLQTPMLLFKENSSTKTHPPTIERFTKLYDIMKKDLTPEEIVRVEEMLVEAKKQINISLNAKSLLEKKQF